MIFIFNFYHEYSNRKGKREKIMWAKISAESSRLFPVCRKIIGKEKL